RGFSGARLADQGDNLSRRQGEIERSENLQLAAAFLVAAGDILKTQHLTHKPAPQPGRAAPRASLDRAWPGTSAPAPSPPRKSLPRDRDRREAGTENRRWSRTAACRSAPTGHP